MIVSVLEWSDFLEENWGVLETADAVIASNFLGESRAEQSTAPLGEGLRGGGVDAQDKWGV